MIRAVLFDVGGTLHVADNTPALADRFSELLIRRLAESGIVLPVDAKSLTPMLHRNAEDYKHWSEQTRRELSGVRIWNEYYLRDFAVGEARWPPSPRSSPGCTTPSGCGTCPGPICRRPWPPCRRWG